MSHIRSFKSAITTRVDPLTSDRLFSESRQLGNPAMCPLSAQSPDVDEFGRPQGGARHRLINLRDSACSNYVYSASRLISHENADRPMMAPCNPGDRGAGDFLYGSARDRYPHGLYGSGERGKWVNPYAPFLKPKEGIPDYNVGFEPQTAKPLGLSHDALIKPYFG